MYKAIIFDLDNTLLNYTHSELDCMKRTLHQHDLLRDEQDEWEIFWEAYSRHNSRYWLDFVNKIGPLQSIEEVLISSFRDSLNRDQGTHERLSATYWHLFCHTCHFEPGAEELLQTVRSQYKLGIISNGIGEAQRQRLQAGKVYELFHSIVVSDEAGIRKPRQEIFELSLNELGLMHEEVLFVGDSITDDYHGALNAGIDFCYYNRHRQELSLAQQPKYVIHELQELLRMIR